MGAGGLGPVVDMKPTAERQGQGAGGITGTDGKLSGRIEKLFSPSRPEPVCEHCTDERKNPPIVGMTILKGLTATGSGWEGGEILDPNNGKTYRAKARLSDDGSRLEVRGFIGVGLFGRTQTWIREQ